MTNCGESYFQRGNITTLPEHLASGFEPLSSLGSNSWQSWAIRNRINDHHLNYHNWRRIGIVIGISDYRVIDSEVIKIISWWNNYTIYFDYDCIDSLVLSTVLVLYYSIYWIALFRNVHSPTIFCPTRMCSKSFSSIDSLNWKFSIRSININQSFIEGN